MKTVLLTLALATLLIAVAIFAMGIKVFFKRGGRFPSGHICHNSEIARRVGTRHRSKNNRTSNLTTKNIDENN